MTTKAREHPKSEKRLGLSSPADMKKTAEASQPNISEALTGVPKEARKDELGVASIAIPTLPDEGLIQLLLQSFLEFSVILPFLACHFHK